MPINGRSFPDLWMSICKLWMIVAVGALIMPAIVWILIFTENTHTFQEVMGHYLGNNLWDYPGDPGCGYVDATNIPKHLGGVVFTAVFDLGMLTLIFLSICADLFWRFEILHHILEAFWAVGVWDDRDLLSIEYFFLIANAFLKLFIVAATGSQTYTGIYPDFKGLDTPLFCLYATMILLCSIPFTVIALMFILSQKKLGEYKAKIAAEKKKAAAKKAAADKEKKENGGGASPA